MAASIAGSGRSSHAQHFCGYSFGLPASKKALALVGFDRLKNVLFNEQTINMKEEVLPATIARKRLEMAAT
jgi:hypothetical protein